MCKDNVCWSAALLCGSSFYIALCRTGVRRSICSDGLPSCVSLSAWLPGHSVIRKVVRVRMVKRISVTPFFEQPGKTMSEESVGAKCSCFTAGGISLYPQPFEACAKFWNILCLGGGRSPRQMPLRFAPRNEGRSAMATRFRGGSPRRRRQLFLVILHSSRSAVRLP